MILCSASGLSSKVTVKYNLTHNPHTSSFLYNLPSLSYCVSSSRKHGRHGEDWADSKRTYTALPCETDHQHAVSDAVVQWCGRMAHLHTSKHLPSVVCLDDTVSTRCLQLLPSPPHPSTAPLPLRVLGIKPRVLSTIGRLSPWSYCPNPWNSFWDPNGCTFKSCLGSAREGLIEI